jgi:hypothetical protein
MDRIVSALGTLWRLRIWALIGRAIAEENVPQNSRWNLFGVEMPYRHLGEEHGRRPLPRIPPGCL